MTDSESLSLRLLYERIQAIEARLEALENSSPEPEDEESPTHYMDGSPVL
jgi:hypothetical protein